MIMEMVRDLDILQERRSEMADIVQEMVRDCGHSTGDGQRLQTYYRRQLETAVILQETFRDCRHGT
ncbi:unnamed protein product, partial [Staurois parvus]